MHVFGIVFDIIKRLDFKKHYIIIVIIIINQTKPHEHENRSQGVSELRQQATMRVSLPRSAVACELCAALLQDPMYIHDI